MTWDLSHRLAFEGALQTKKTRDIPSSFSRKGGLVERVDSNAQGMEQFPFVVLDAPGIAKGCELWIKRQGFVNGDVERRGDITARLAERIDPLPTMGAREIGHVLHDAKDGDVHHGSHLDGLLDDLGDEFLGARDDDRRVDRKLLEDGEGDVARSGRHVDIELVDVPIGAVGPELLDEAGDDGPAPNDGIRAVLKKQAQRHHLDAGFA